MPKFADSYRLERIYFEKLRSDIDVAKSYIDAGATGEALDTLRGLVDVDGAVLLLYRNLGEIWADLAAQIQKTKEALDDLIKTVDDYHKELNEKIDEVNNYLIRLINALEDRVIALEAETKVKYAGLIYDSTGDEYSIEIDGETLTFSEAAALVNYPHLLILVDEQGNYYYPRKTETGAIEWENSTIDNGDYTENVITFDASGVTKAENTIVIPEYTAGTGIDITGYEISVDTDVIQEKLTAGQNIQISAQNVISATDTTYSAGVGIDIDNSNVISADFNEVQAKLTAGSGISIDPDTNEISNTAQGVTYRAGNNIEITNDVISTKASGIMTTFGSLYDLGMLANISVGNFYNTRSTPVFNLYPRQNIFPEGTLKRNYFYRIRFSDSYSLSNLSFRGYGILHIPLMIQGTKGSNTITAMVENILIPFISEGNTLRFLNYQKHIDFTAFIDAFDNVTRIFIESIYAIGICSAAGQLPLPGIYELSQTD